MLANVATRQDDVRDPPARRDRRTGSRRARRTGSRSARGRGSGRRRRRGPGRPARPGGSAGPGRRATTHRTAPIVASEQDRPDRRPPGSARTWPTPGAAARRRPRTRVADPQAGVGEAVPGVARDERPRVVGVDRQVRVAAAGDDDLVDEPGRRGTAAGRLSSRTDSPNGRHSTTAVRKPASARRQDPQRRPVRAPSAQSAESGAGRGDRRRVPASTGHSARRMVTTATSGTRMPSCGLMIAAMTVKIAARSGLVAPQLAQAEQQEHDAERVDLAPDDAVEPGDRVERRRRAAASSASRSRPPSSRTIDQTSQPMAEVGQDRRDLDQVADAADGAARPCPTSHRTYR